MHVYLCGLGDSMKIGIIGIPRSGKTSLFNAVTRGSAIVGSYSAANEPNIGTVQVPDTRLDALVKIYNPKKTTYAEIQWVDYPYSGIGSSGIDQQLVKSLGDLDVLVHVVRSFADASVPHDQGSIDVDRDIGVLELELQFADLELIEKRITRIENEMRSLKTAERVEIERHQKLLNRMKLHLEEGFNLRTLEMTEIEVQEVKHYSFVTLIPELLIINIGEEQLGDIEEIVNNVTSRHGSPGRAIVLICAKVEAELSTMNLDEALEFRSELGLTGDPPLHNAITITYDMLGLHSFLTAGEDECRAWPIQKGLTAPQAAGKIHSDLERGFIRVEVASYEELILAGSMAELKKRGQLRTEGKQYIVEDGDVMNVLFNV